MLRLLSLLLVRSSCGSSCATRRIRSSRSTFRDIPVTITGEEELLASQGLSVIESTATVDCGRGGAKQRGNRPKRRRRKITATVDVSSITDGAGEYNRPVQVAVSSADIDPVRANPVSVSVLVDKATTVSVPVRIDVTGTPAEGYRAGKASTHDDRVGNGRGAGGRAERGR